MGRVVLLTVLIFIFSISAVYAVNFPQYSQENKYVTDTAGIISPEWRAQITALCAEVENNTSAQIAVVTINSTEDLSIEEYAVQLFEKWGIGQKGTDNGLLVLIAVNDKTYRIEVGYGLEGVLNAAKVGRVGRNYFVENFQAGEYGKGIYLGVQAMSQEIRGEGSSLSAPTQDYTPIIIFIIFFAIWMIPLILRFVAKKYGKQTGPGQWLLWGMMLNMGRGRGGFGGLGGGGFGGFGGGGSGGGGASGRW